jgi:hypothetical protein
MTHIVSSCRCGTAVLALLWVAAGCAQLDLRKGIPWADTAEDSQQPVRVVAIWTDTVMSRAGAVPTRGFGGRLMFFADKQDKPIKVQGTLVVYAFDESRSEGEKHVPDRRYVFRAEELEKHYSQSKLGHSYSVWLPWDVVGGPQREITLLVRFVGSNGGVLVGEPSTHLLPGPETPLGAQSLHAPQRPPVPTSTAQTTVYPPRQTMTQPLGPAMGQAPGQAMMQPLAPTMGQPQESAMAPPGAPAMAPAPAASQVPQPLGGAVQQASYLAPVGSLAASSRYPADELHTAAPAASESGIDGQRRMVTTTIPLPRAAWQTVQQEPQAGGAAWAAAMPGYAVGPAAPPGYVPGASGAAPMPAGTATVPYAPQAGPYAPPGTMQTGAASPATATGHPQGASLSPSARFEPTRLRAPNGAIVRPDRGRAPWQPPPARWPYAPGG